MCFIWVHARCLGHCQGIELVDNLWRLSPETFEKLYQAGKYFAVENSDYGDKTRPDGFRWKSDGPPYGKKDCPYVKRFFKLEGPSARYAENISSPNVEEAIISIAQVAQRMKLDLFSERPAPEEPKFSIGLLKVTKGGGTKGSRAAKRVREAETDQ